MYLLVEDLIVFRAMPSHVFRTDGVAADFTAFRMTQNRLLGLDLSPADILDRSTANYVGISQQNRQAHSNTRDLAGVETSFRYHFGR